MKNLDKKTKNELISLLENLGVQLEELEKENERLKKEVETAADAAADAVADTVVEMLRADKKRLRELVEISCRENCPHHKNEEACKNCSVAADLAEIDREGGADGE